MAVRYSDCCSSCWFNQSGKRPPAGDGPEDEPARCTLRQFFIEEPHNTHCANHPLRYPDQLGTPVGPVYRTDSLGVRTVWRLSPDTEEVRLNMLRLLTEMPEEPRSEYPFGIPFDEVLVWQLGEFHERRAVEGLRRVACFDANRSDPVFGLNRFMTVRRSLEALAKIEGKPENLGIGPTDVPR